MTQETFLTAFVEGVQTTAERFIQVSQFDKTIEATIIEKNTENKTYYISTQGGVQFYVSALATDNSVYSIGDQVYISLPNGDYNSNNKYIIGKVNKITPTIVIFQKDDYIIEDYNITTTDHSNKNCYQMMIIEFDAYVETNNKEARGIKEFAIGFDIYGRIRENTENWAHYPNFWSSKSLYGNIFDNTFINKQKIVIRNLEDLYTFGIKWENMDSSNNTITHSVELLDIYGNTLNSTGVLKINNIIYYIGYDIEKIKQNQIQNTSILLTNNGYKLFHQKDGIWSKITLDELLELEPDFNWTINWYNWNPLQEEYSDIDNEVPQFWDLLNTEPSTYENKLVLLQCDSGSKTTTKSIYSILR